MGKVVWGSLWGSWLPPSLLDSEDMEHLWVPAGTWAVRLGAAGGPRDRQRGGRERGFVSILTLESKKRGGGGEIVLCAVSFRELSHLVIRGGAVLASPSALLCWPAPLFIQPPFDLLNCC